MIDEDGVDYGKPISCSSPPQERRHMASTGTGTSPKVQGRNLKHVSSPRPPLYAESRGACRPAFPTTEGGSAPSNDSPARHCRKGVLPAVLRRPRPHRLSAGRCMSARWPYELHDKVKAAGDGGNTGIRSAATRRAQGPSAMSTSTAAPGGARPGRRVDGNSEQCFANMATIRRGTEPRADQAPAYEFAGPGTGWAPERIEAAGVPPRITLPRVGGILQVRSDRRDPRPFGLMAQPGRPVGELF